MSRSFHPGLEPEAHGPAIHPNHCGVSGEEWPALESRGLPEWLAGFYRRGGCYHPEGDPRLEEIVEDLEAGLNGFGSLLAGLGNARKARTAAVPTLQQQLAEKFLAKLAETGTLEPERIEQLRVLLSSGKKVTAEELVKLFSAPAGEDIK